MPNTESAKKRQRQGEVRRLRNRSVKSAIKTQVRKVRDAATAGNMEAGEQDFRLAAKRVDKAAASGVIHRNVAARLKSRLARALKSAKKKA